MIVKIDGIELSDFTLNEIVFNYDAVSDTFSLTTAFFEYWEKSKRIFKPLKYATVEIFDDTKRKLLTGTLLNHRFRDNASGSELSVSGYSKTGILDDCPDVKNFISNNPGDSTNYSELTLLELAKKLSEPYKIEVIVDDLVKSKVNEKYDQSTTDQSQSIASYLAKLATLKNVVMRSTPAGQLRFTQVDPKLRPIAKFSTGDGVCNEITLEVNGQAMHSEIHNLSGVGLSENTIEDKEKVGSAEKIINPLLGKVFRPTIKTQGVETGAIKEVTKAALADELKNITIQINCKGWKLVDEGILAPGDLVSVFAPGAYLFQYTTLLIRSIRLKEDSKEKSSSLSCVLPETMTGEQPKLIFN